MSFGFKIYGLPQEIAAPLALPTSAEALVCHWRLEEMDDVHVTQAAPPRLLVSLFSDGLGSRVFLGVGILGCAFFCGAWV